MKTRNVVILVAAAVVLSLLALINSFKQSQYASPAESKKVLPGLPVNDITAIVITDGSNTSELARAEDRWVASNLYNYPVKFNKVRQAILDLYELTVGQTVNADQSQLENLRIVPPGKATDNTGTLIELYAGKNGPAASLLLGRQRMSSGTDRFNAGGYPTGRYVSPDKGKTVYLVSETLSNLSAEITEWLNSQIVHVPSSDVKIVTVKKRDAEPFTLAMDEDENTLELKDLGENYEMDTTETYDLQSALSYFRFDTIADPSMTEESMGLDNPSVFTVLTKDGIAYNVTVGSVVSEEDPSRYIRLEASLAQNEQQSGNGKEEPEDESSDPKTGENPADKIKSLNRQTEGWTYIVAEHKIESMLKNREELIKEKETRDKAQDGEASAQAGNEN